MIAEASQRRQQKPEMYTTHLYKPELYSSNQPELYGSSLPYRTYSQQESSESHQYLSKQKMNNPLKKQYRPQYKKSSISQSPYEQMYSPRLYRRPVGYSASEFRYLGPEFSPFYRNWNYMKKQYSA